MLVPRVYEQSSGGWTTLIVVAMPILPHLLEVVSERLASPSVGTHMTGAGAGPSVSFSGPENLGD